MNEALGDEALGRVDDLQAPRREFANAGLPRPLQAHAQTWLLPPFFAMWSRARDRRVARALELLLHGLVPRAPFGSGPGG